MGPISIDNRWAVVMDLLVPDGLPIVMGLIEVDRPLVVPEPRVARGALVVAELVPAGRSRATNDTMATDGLLVVLSLTLFKRLVELALADPTLLLGRTTGGLGTLALLGISVHGTRFTGSRTSRRAGVSVLALSVELRLLIKIIGWPTASDRTRLRAGVDVFTISQRRLMLRGQASRTGAGPRPGMRTGVNRILMPVWLRRLVSDIILSDARARPRSGWRGSTHRFMLLIRLGRLVSCIVSSDAGTRAGPGRCSGLHRVMLVIGLRRLVGDEI
jgi:hypothetical protein